MLTFSTPISLFLDRMTPVKQFPQVVEIGTKASVEDDKTVDSFDSKHVIIHQNNRQKRLWYLSLASAIVLIVVAIVIVVAVLLNSRKVHASTSLRSSQNAYVTGLGTNLSSGFHHSDNGMMGHHGDGNGPPGNQGGEARDDCNSTNHSFFFRNHSNWSHVNNGNQTEQDNHTEWGNPSDPFDEHSSGRSSSSTHGHP